MRRRKRCGDDRNDVSNAAPGASSACWPARLSRSRWGSPAKATDEIQVYNAGIAAVGQFTIEQHLNYVPLGVKDPPFPGGLVSNHSINGTPEFAYGVTDWWEVGLYLPFAIKDQQFLSDAFKLRTLFVSPNAEQRNFFYGVNFEFSNTTPKFSQSRFALEIRPIIGVRNADYEFIVNPIVDVSFGKLGEAGLCARGAPGAKARAGYVFGARILRRLWRDRELRRSSPISNTRCSRSPISSSASLTWTSASVTD